MNFFIPYLLYSTLSTYSSAADDKKDDKGQASTTFTGHAYSRAVIKTSFTVPDNVALVGIYVQAPSGGDRKKLFNVKTSEKTIEVLEQFKSILKVQFVGEELELTFEPLTSEFAGKLVCYADGNKDDTVNGCGGTTIVVDGDCPVNFEKLAHKCYIYINQTSNKTFSAASDHCKSLYAFLAEPRNVLEFALVAKFTKAKSNSSINATWLGGKKASKKDTAVWLSDGQRLSYDKWAPGYPKEKEGDHLGLITNLTKPHLVNLGGDKPKAFLCQMNLEPSSSGPSSSGPSSSGPSSSGPSSSAPDKAEADDSESSDSHSLESSSQGSLVIALSVSLIRISYF